MAGMNSSSSLQIETLGIVGVGLIGGSIALAAKHFGVAKHVIGSGRSAEKLNRAIDAGIIDRGVIDVDELATADLVVICTPVDRIAADVQAVLQASNSRCLVTDAGSVKGNICEAVTQLAEGDRFVGAHPIAGSQKSGFEFAQSTLFQGRHCVVTPSSSGTISSSDAVQTVEAFWSSIGMVMHRMSPQEHDRVLALTSHLPHFAAALVASLTTENELPFTGTGFRDTTRIAAGDPGLWTAIFSENKAEMAVSLKRMSDAIDSFRSSLMNEKTEAVRLFLEQAQLIRRKLDEEPN